jgi:hypothetical protein
MDGVDPPCEKGQCPIPGLSAGEARVMEMRSLLIRLRGVVDGGTVLRTYGATIDELELLGAIEDELREEGDKEA